MKYESTDTTVIWLKDTFDTNITESELHPIFNFLLIWSLFEYKLFNSNGNKLTARLLIEKGQIECTIDIQSAVDCLFAYFKKRYIINNNEHSDKFEKLRLIEYGKLRINDINISEFVFNTLRNDSAEINDKLTCLFAIIYRFRNGA